MRRISLYGTFVIVGHLAVVVWHLIVLARLHGFLTVKQVALFSVLANLLPFIALILLWARFVRLAGWLLLIPLGLALFFGGYAHF